MTLLCLGSNNTAMDNTQPPHLSVPGESLRPDSVVQWSRQPIAATVGEEVVLMNLERGRCYGLGPTGTDLWQKMSRPVQVSELLRQLEAEYDVSSRQLELDVLQVLQQYAEEGLIEVRPSLASGG